MANKERTYCGPDLRSRPYDTKEAQIGYWRTFQRQKGIACPVCGHVSHAFGCSEAEYPVAKP